MVKYPSLEGRQCKVYTSKVELLESQVLTTLFLLVTYGLALATTEKWKPQLIETLFQRLQREVNIPVNY